MVNSTITYTPSMYNKPPKSPLSGGFRGLPLIGRVYLPGGFLVGATPRWIPDKSGQAGLRNLWLSYCRRFSKIDIGGSRYEPDLRECRKQSITLVGSEYKERITHALRLPPVYSPLSAMLIELISSKWRYSVAMRL